jgi:hypothetical protein
MLRACQAYPQSVFVDALSVFVDALSLFVDALSLFVDALSVSGIPSEPLRRCSERVRHTLRASSSML